MLGFAPIAPSNRKTSKSFHRPIDYMLLNTYPKLIEKILCRCGVENPPLFEGGKTLSEGTGDSLKGDGTEWQDVY